MTEKFISKLKLKTRRRNYLPKKSLQYRMIGQIVVAIIISMLVSVGITSLLYYDLSNVQFQGDVPFYYITEDLQHSGDVPTALDVIFPALLISGGIMVVSTVIIGIFATHRIFGAIYRFERVTEEIGQGNFNLLVKIRQKDNFQELADNFNQMLRRLNQQLKIVREDLLRLKPLAQKDKSGNKLLEQALDDLNYFKIDDKQ